MVSFCQDKEQLDSSSTVFSPALGSCGAIQAGSWDPVTRIHQCHFIPFQANWFLHKCSFAMSHKESERWTRATLERETRLSLRAGESCDPHVSLRGLRSDTVGSQSTRTRQRFGYRKLSKIREGRGSCLWRVINLFHLDEINRKTGIEGDHLCKIVGLIFFESAHLILAKRLREQTGLNYPGCCWPALEFGRWLAGDNPELWTASCAEDISQPLMATGALAAVPALDAQQGHTYLWNTRSYPLFSTFPFLLPVYSPWGQTALNQYVFKDRMPENYRFYSVQLFRAKTWFSDRQGI